MIVEKKNRKPSEKRKSNETTIVPLETSKFDQAKAFETIKRLRTKKILREKANTNVNTPKA